MQVTIDMYGDAPWPVDLDGRVAALIAESPGGGYTWQPLEPSLPRLHGAATLRDLTTMLRENGMTVGFVGSLLPVQPTSTGGTATPA